MYKNLVLLSEFSFSILENDQIICEEIRKNYKTLRNKGISRNVFSDILSKKLNEINEELKKCIKENLNINLKAK